MHSGESPKRLETISSSGWEQWDDASLKAA
jgi:hypothetical protein